MAVDVDEVLLLERSLPGLGDSPDTKSDGYSVPCMSTEVAGVAHLDKSGGDRDITISLKVDRCGRSLG